MATEQAQPTTFSGKGPEYQVFERLYSTPSLLLRDAAVVQSGSLPEIARGDARPMTINLEWVFSWDRNGQFHKIPFDFGPISFLY